MRVEVFGSNCTFSATCGGSILNNPAGSTLGGGRSQNNVDASGNCGVHRDVNGDGNARTSGDYMDVCECARLLSDVWREQLVQLGGIHIGRRPLAERASDVGLPSPKFGLVDLRMGGAMAWLGFGFGVVQGREPVAERAGGVGLLPPHFGLVGLRVGSGERGDGGCQLVRWLFSERGWGWVVGGGWWVGVASGRRLVGWQQG